MGLLIDHQQVCDFDVRQGFRAASIRCGSTKNHDLHRDDRSTDLKTCDGVYEEQPIQLDHFGRQDTP